MKEEQYQDSCVLMKSSMETHEYEGRAVWRHMSMKEEQYGDT